MDQISWFPSLFCPTLIIARTEKPGELFFTYAASIAKGIRTAKVVQTALMLLLVTHPALHPGGAIDDLPVIVIKCEGLPIRAQRVGILMKHLQVLASAQPGSCKLRIERQAPFVIRKRRVRLVQDIEYVAQAEQIFGFVPGSAKFTKYFLYERLDALILPAAVFEFFNQIDYLVLVVRQDRIKMHVERHHHQCRLQGLLGMSLALGLPQVQGRQTVLERIEVEAHGQSAQRSLLFT